MGSLFNNSNSSWDNFDRMSPFKKDNLSLEGNSNGTYELFNDNMIVEMKRKEFGITDLDQFNSTDEGRVSPMQIERLLKEIMAQEIIDVANNIAIPVDPRQWSVEDTCAWLTHYAIKYSIPGNSTEFLKADGETICSYKLQDFVVRIGCETAGNKIKDQLDLWKEAGRSMYGGAQLAFPKQPMYMNPKLEEADQCSRSQSTKFGLDISCGWAAPPPQVFSMPTPELMSPNQFVNNTTQHNSIQQNNMNTQNRYPEIGTSTFQPFTQNNQPSIAPYFAHEGRYLPKPTIPLDRFASVREACQDTGILSIENYQKFINMTPPPMMFPNLGTSSGGQSSSKSSMQMQATGTAQFDDSFEDAREHLTSQQGTAAPQHVRQDEPARQMELKTPVMHDMDKDNIESSYLDLNLVNMKQEVETNSPDLPNPDEPPIQNHATDKPAKKKSSKHPIHLWEFLKQLLHEGKDCIRWIDEEKGIFKIYNSQQVAKHWGERKNRPAMNYDKLSRSIRQYYKKGIIKKTTQGKRLVYQFCEAYL